MLWAWYSCKLFFPAREACFILKGDKYKIKRVETDGSIAVDRNISRDEVPKYINKGPIIAIHIKKGEIDNNDIKRAFCESDPFTPNWYD